VISLQLNLKSVAKVGVRSGGVELGLSPSEVLDDLLVLDTVDIHANLVHPDTVDFVGQDNHFVSNHAVEKFVVKIDSKVEAQVS